MEKGFTAVLRSGAIGDLLQTVPALKHLKEKKPETEILFICGASCAPAIENSLYIDKLLTFDDRIIYSGTSFQKAKETLKISKMLKGAKVCFVLHEDKRWAIPAMLAGIYDIRTLSSVSEYSFRAERFCTLLTGEQPAGYSLSFHSAPHTPEDVQQPYIAMAAGGARNSKSDDACRRWSGYAELIRMILDKTNCHIVMLGLNEDSVEITDQRIINCCGKTSLSDACRIISSAKLFIGNDSGLLHLACCTDTYKIGIFTATDPAEVLGDQKNTAVISSGLSCSPCEKNGRFRTDCKNECRESIKAEDIFNLIASQVECLL